MRQSSDPRGFVLDHLHFLEELWTRVRDAEPDAVHQARVATRRIRAGLPHLAGVNAEAAKTFRNMGRQLGRVRELDVTSDILSNLQPDLPEAANVIAAVQLQVAEQLQRRRRRLIKALDDINVRRLRDRFASAPAVARITSLWRDWRTDVRRELGKCAVNVRAAIERASGVYMPNRAHDVRIAVKKLRYKLELATATGLSQNRTLLAELQAAQKVLGQLHDWRVLSQAIQHSDLGSALAPEKAVLDSVVSVESSRLHRKYVRLRDSVVNVCMACARLENEWHTLERLGRLATRTVYAAGVVGVPLAVWHLQNGPRDYDARETSVRVSAVD